MIKKLTLGAALIAVAAIFTPASAAPLTPAGANVADTGLIQQVHWRHHHRYWGNYYYPRHYYYRHHYWWWRHRHHHRHHW